MGGGGQHAREAVGEAVILKVVGLSVLTVWLVIWLIAMWEYRG